MRSIIEFISTLNKSRKSQLYLLLIAIIFSNFAEVLSIGLIPPYLALIANTELLNTNSYLIYIRSYFTFSDTQFMVFLGVVIFLLILFSNIFLALLAYISKKFINALHNNITTNLFDYHINLKFDASFLDKNSLTIVSTKLNTEVSKFCNQCLLPFIEIYKRFFAMIIMISFLFYVEPIFTLFISFFFLIVILIFYKLLHKKFQSFGSIITKRTQQKTSLILESFSSLREVKFLGIQNQLLREFFKNNLNIFDADVKIYILGNLPKYLLEVVSAFLFLSLLIFFIINGDNFENIIYTLSFVVIAAYKILPSLNTAMYNFSVLKSSLASYEYIEEDLNSIHKLSINRKNEFSNNQKNYKNNFDYSINFLEFNKISYSYPSSKNNALTDINMKIDLNKSYFIVGASGSGKSTLIDLLSGILNPSQGKYKIYNDSIDTNNLETIKDLISYVPQQINFFNRSLIENITLNFGNNSPEDIDFIKTLIDLVDLTSFIDSLPNGIESNLGDKIQNMSGGQKQRISIARALYRKKSILLLDEATSALDTETESKIFDGLSKLDFIKSIICITHRESILKPKDNCIVLDKGKIIFQGFYQDYKMHS